MAEQKKYKFRIIVNYYDHKNNKEIKNMTTKEARKYCSNLTELENVDYVELYRIDKTEIFT